MTDSIEPFDPPLTDGEWEPFAAALGIDPPFISEAHYDFTVTVTCVTCGWHWEGWLTDIAAVAAGHTLETGHA